MPKVYVLGAGVDATQGIGMPLNNELLPRITQFLNTDQGKEIDGKLRAIYPQLRFRFSTFIEKAIDDMARNFNDEVVTIKERVSQELEDNDQLTEEQRNMGALITRLMDKVHDMADRAALDDETERLITVVFGQEMVHDDSIIDLHKVVFSGTFQTVVKLLLTRSLETPNDAILRHMNKNFLDIEKLLVQYFVGFFIGKTYDIKIYSYISWMLWAYLLHCEQEIINELGDNIANLPVYSQIDQESTIINFNYTTFGRMFVNSHHGSDIHYFHGSLLDYIDIKRNHVFTNDLISFKDLDICNFVDENLSPNVDFNSDPQHITIPSFMPPVSIKPIMSQKNIETWYKSFDSLKHANEIIIIGYSFNSSDEHFNGMLRDCREIPLVVVDTNVEAIKRMLQPIYNVQPNDFVLEHVQGHNAFVAQGIKIIKAQAHEIDYTQL